MKNLAQKIKDSGLKKQFIADVLGISNATLSRIIAGKQDYTSPQLLEKLINLLDQKKA